MENPENMFPAKASFYFPERSEGRIAYENRSFSVNFTTIVDLFFDFSNII